MKQYKMVSERGLSLYLGGMQNNTLSVDHCLTIKKERNSQETEKKSVRIRELFRVREV